MIADARIDCQPTATYIRQDISRIPFAYGFNDPHARETDMPIRRHLFDLIQRLSYDESKRQPSAEAWLWAQDHLETGEISETDIDEIVSLAAKFTATPAELSEALDAVGCKPKDMGEFLARRRQN